jgi:hypothetical protein
MSNATHRNRIKMILSNRGVGQGVSGTGPFRGSKPLSDIQFYNRKPDAPLIDPAIIKPAFDESSPRPFL